MRRGPGQAASLDPCPLASSHLQPCPQPPCRCIVRCAAGVPLTTVDSLLDGLGEGVLAVLDAEPEAALRQLR